MAHQPLSHDHHEAFSRRGIHAASAVVSRAPRFAAEPRWRLAEVSGRLVELSGAHAASWLTMAFALVLDAQQRGEPAAWITARAATFFPPDAALTGIDLSALPVVFTADAHEAARAADKLARSGAFGLLVLDLLGGRPELPPALQSRLAGLAERHDTAIVCLTEKPSSAASLGPMVSLRLETRRDDPRDAAFTCRVGALRDKRRALAWADVEVCRGPAGLR